MVIADVNGDQRPDLLAVKPLEPSSIVVLLGDGEGNYGEPAFVSAGSSPSSLTTADLNGDRIVDLVVANGASDEVAVLLGGGKGTFGPATFFPAGHSPASMAIGDLNGDQVPDLAVTNSGTDKIAILFGTGNGAFGAADTLLVGLGPRSVAIGDLNGDRALDLAVANAGSDNVAVLLGGSGGAIGAATFYGAGASPQALVISDLNGDQVPDLAVANGESDDVALLRGIGDGTFGGATFFAAGNRPLSLAVHDLNDDQALDLVVGGQGHVAVLRGIGDGTFVSPASYAIAWFAESVASGDLNGDHVPDLAIANYNDIAVLLGLGDGTFGAPSTYLEGTHSRDWEPGSIVTRDLNDDRILDLVVSDPESDEVVVLLASGDGTFRVAGYYATGYWPNSVAIGDLNGDKILDLAVATSRLGPIAILLGLGDGRFGPATYFEGGDYLSSLQMADLNGDQVLDLAAIADKGLVVLLGLGGADFGPPNFFAIASTPASLAVGDLNGDQVPDMAVVRFLSDNVELLFGVGDGTFAPADQYPVGRVLRSVVIDDLNGDAASDLAVASADNKSQGLAVLLGHGDGTFSAPTFYPAGVSLQSVSIADFNGDQLPDAVIANGESNNIAVLLGAGDGSFGPPDFYGAGDYPVGTAIGDFNGDQLPDLAAVAAQITILLAFRAPAISTPAVLRFPAVSVGDSVVADLTVSNTGLTSVPITNVVLPSPEMRLAASLPIYIEAGAAQALPILLEPRQRLNVTGNLRLHTIVGPPTTVQVEGEIHPLAVSTRREPPDERVELGQELTIIVTPDPQVHVERGAVHYSILDIGAEFVIPLNPSPEGFDAIIPSRHVTEDGLKYYIQVENSGVIATDPPGAPDSTYAVRVRFSSFPLPNAGERFLEGRPIQVITNFSSIDSGTLYYRRAAERTYRSVAIDTQQPIPVATIPDSVVGPRGIEYWMQIVRGTDTQTDPPAWIGEWPRTIRVTAEGLREEHDYDGDGRYRMVSVPLDFGRNITLEALLSDQAAFGPYDPLKWRSFRYAEADSEQRYVELSEAAFPEVHRVIPGRAFWLASRNPGRIETAPIAGTSTPHDDFFPVAVQPGWNQIGDPFLFPVAWDSMAVVMREEIFPMSEAVGVIEPPIAWRHQGYEDSVKVLDPFDGYWVNCLADTTITLLVPPREASLEPAPREPGRTPISVEERMEGWAIAIRATAAGAMDGANVAGVSPGAVSAWDAADRSEPPMAPGESISLYFPHAAWEKHPGRYTADMRGAYEPLAAARDVASLLPDPEAWGHAWRFDVAKSFTRAGVDEVQLEFAGLDRVPKDALILLLDRRLGTARDLRTDSHYAFYLGVQPAVASEENARFVLVVGSAAFRDVALGELPGPPARTALYPSYPNPFNPATLIRFDIANSGPVTVGIYDVRGALVKVLAEGRREPGRYEITWNGEDPAGHRVASGIYFYRLKGEHFSAARKMIMLR